MFQRLPIGILNTDFTCPEAIYLSTTALSPNSPFPLLIYRKYFPPATLSPSPSENHLSTSSSGSTSRAGLSDDDESQGLYNGEVEVKQNSKPAQITPISPEIIEEHFRANSWIPEWRYSMFYQAHYHSTTHEALGIYQGSALLRFGVSDQECEPSKLEYNGDEDEEEDGGQNPEKVVEHINENEYRGPETELDITKTADSTVPGSIAGLKGYFITVHPGDVIVIPAGVTHRLIKDLTPAGKTDDHSIPGLRFVNGFKLHNYPKFKMVGAYPLNAKRWDMCYGGEHAIDTFEQICVDVPSTDPVLGEARLSGEDAVGIELWRKIEKEGGVQKWLSGGE